MDLVISVRHVTWELIYLLTPVLGQTVGNNPIFDRNNADKDMWQSIQCEKCRAQLNKHQANGLWYYIFYNVSTAWVFCAAVSWNASSTPEICTNIFCNASTAPEFHITASCTASLTGNFCATVLCNASISMIYLCHSIHYCFCSIRFLSYNASSTGIVALTPSWSESSSVV